MSKKKKIIITGGLGYIGTELCKLYSGVSWHHQITVIDNKDLDGKEMEIGTHQDTHQSTLTVLTLNYVCIMSFQSVEVPIFQITSNRN